MRIKKNFARLIEPDSRYQSVLIAKLINRTTKDGKKSVAMKQVYRAIDDVCSEIKHKPEELMEELVDKVAPKMEVRSRRVGGASYQVPMPVSRTRSISLAIRWLVWEANKRPNKKYHTFAEKLAAEMKDALTEQGGSIDRRNRAHRMAEANKAFAHFRW